MTTGMKSIIRGVRELRCWGVLILVVGCWIGSEPSRAADKAGTAKSNKPEAPKTSSTQSDREAKNEKKGEKKAQKGEKKNVTLDFEDELVTGDAAQPEVMAIMERQEFNFKRLIRLRKDFLNEMKKTSEDLERGNR